jgi:hypothetical protein
MCKWQYSVETGYRDNKSLLKITWVNMPEQRIGIRKELVAQFSNKFWLDPAISVVEACTYCITASGLVSSPGEFHPEALAEPYVNVSVHTAPIIQPEKGPQEANARTARVDNELPVQANVWHALSNVPSSCIST